MATSQPNAVIQQLCRSAILPDLVGWTDEQLLNTFIRSRDEAAFAVLVRRHGPMVMGVCRRVLSNRTDAEDAFQATFLVLVKKAASIASRQLLANWLYGVAYNTARRAKAAVARRRARERQVAEMPDSQEPEESRWSDLRSLLDQELSQLPERYRIPLVLCYLEGKSRREAAQQLGWPEGTVAGRLARARALLARRLARRGLALSAASLAALLPQEATAWVSPSVSSLTVKAATLLAAGEPAAGGVIPANILALTEGVLRAMWIRKITLTSVLLLIVACVGLGVGGSIFRTQAAAEADLTAQPKAAAQPKGGKAVNGIVASAVVVEKPVKGGTSFEVQFVLKNVSEKPLTVCDYLGYEPLKVEWIGPDGKRRESTHYAWLAFADLKALGKDNFPVLPAGDSRSIEHGIVFYSPMDKPLLGWGGVPSNVAQPGRHRVTVSYSNKDDGKRFNLQNVWTGTVTANEVTFIVENSKPKEDPAAALIHEAVFRHAFTSRAAEGAKDRLNFLSIMGKDPPPEFLNRFKDHRPPVRRGSEFKQGDGVKFHIEDLKRIDDDTVEVNGGYYVGPRSAASYLYRVVRKQGKWVVEKAELKEIS